MPALPSVRVAETDSAHELRSDAKSAEKRSVHLAGQASITHAPELSRSLRMTPGCDFSDSMWISGAPRLQQLFDHHRKPPILHQTFPVQISHQGSTSISMPPICVAARAAPAVPTASSPRSSVTAFSSAMKQHSPALLSNNALV